jgi:hypothetical protein
VRSLAILFSVLVVGCVTGCSTTKEPAAKGSQAAAASAGAAAHIASPAPAASVDARAGELVAYFASVARADSVAQKKELSSSLAAFGRSATPYARLKLGGLYALPVPPLRDDARALALLEPLAVGPLTKADKAVFDLALILYTQVAERERLAKDDAKKQDDLRERIESMRSIDRSIIEREERQRTR